MTEADRDDRADSARALLSRALGWSVAVVFVLIVAAQQTNGPIVDTRRDIALTMFFAIKQDIPVATLFLLAFVGWRMRVGRTSGTPTRMALGGRQAGAMLGAAALGIWLLRLFAFADYDLSRDEQMVSFDAAIFRSGHLYAPIPAFWRQFTDALNVAYTLPIGDREGWVSNYLPGNAALRALLGTVVPPSLIGGLFVAVGGMALWRLALRLFPESASTRTVMLLLYLGSSQVIVTGTTTYAMTAHMAANLVWLWLFLQRRPIAQAGAIAVGFVATGLHQPLFHPLFVAPFLILLWRERAWKELGIYVIAYGLIGLFWLGWQPWLSSLGVHAVPAAHQIDGVSALDRLRAAMRPVDQYSLWVMGANLLRFVAWQHLALLPLALIPLLTRGRGEPLTMALWLGPLLLVVVLTIILPIQANGWGYRYLAGFIGSLILLAGMGWHWLEQRGAAPARAFLVATALSLLALLPIHVWMAAGQIRAYALAAEAVRNIDADVVVVDEGIRFSEDLVLNRPDLTNRPILLRGAFLKPAEMAVLCRGRTIAFADAPVLSSVSDLFRLPHPVQATPEQQQLQQAAKAAGCRIRPYPASRERAPGRGPADRQPDIAPVVAEQDDRRCRRGQPHRPAGKIVEQIERRPGQRHAEQRTTHEAGQRRQPRRLAIGHLRMPDVADQPPGEPREQDVGEERPVEQVHRDQHGIADQSAESGADQVAQAARAEQHGDAFAEAHLTALRPC